MDESLPRVRVRISSTFLIACPYLNQLDGHAKVTDQGANRCHLLRVLRAEVYFIRLNLLSNRDIYDSERDVTLKRSNISNSGLQ